MATKYPSQIDNTSTLPKVVDNSTPIKASTVNNLRDAIINIESELGIKPSSVYGTVRARLDYLENILNVSQTILLANDLGGTASLPKVIGIQGNPISSVDPDIGQVLTWNGSIWLPLDPDSPIEFSGDLSGTDTNQLVVGLNGYPIASYTPSNNDVLQYSLSGSEWISKQLNLDTINPPLGVTIDSNKYVEVGETVTPILNNTYNFTPTAILFSDSEGNSNVLISPPYDTITSPYAYTKSNYGDTVTITLTMTDGINTETETFTITWVQKVYYGVAPSAPLTELFVLNLDNSKLYYDIDEIGPLGFEIPSGYLCFAIRSAHNNLFFTLNKIPGGFTNVGDVSVTNANGFAENYTIFRTDNAALGDSLLEIESADFDLIPYVP